MPAKAIFRPINALFPSVMKRYSDACDLSILRAKNYIHKVLIINCLFISCFFPLSTAQNSNEFVFNRLVLNFLEGEQKPLRKVEGFLTPVLKSEILISAGADIDLTVGDPEVSYKKSENKKVIRELSVALIFQDSIGHEFKLTQTDTLGREEYKMSRDTDFRKLRGPSPFFFQLFIVPALAIGTGIAITIFLFYTRS